MAAQTLIHFRGAQRTGHITLVLRPRLPQNAEVRMLTDMAAKIGTHRAARRKLCRQKFTTTAFTLALGRSKGADYYTHPDEAKLENISAP